ncbi:DUF6520 family protein [Myroides odoratus]|uniref:Uncharacterized protein n=1 Tax=Myroides odoratus TaxID=256 RepID=A0A378RL62_MYROD|nr:DUF6520 family protein [Myroides odoratus]QQU02175.1 hypothetical protein I6I89_09845 [Myroides odoratus]STZ26917.1 Uncharacterised protein [Myroides odoratus]
MKNLKQLLVPIAVVAVGVISAFATQMSNTNESLLEASTPELGWIENETPCQIEHMCYSDGDYLCTVLIDNQRYPVKGKFNPNDTECTKTLYQIIP